MVPPEGLMRLDASRAADAHMPVAWDPVGEKPRAPEGGNEDELARAADPEWTGQGGGGAGERRLLRGDRGSLDAGWQRRCAGREPDLFVVATNLVYYGTHVFAYTIGDANPEQKQLHQVAAHHARVSAAMISSAFLPLVVALVLEFIGVDHDRATNIGVLTAAACWSRSRSPVRTCTGSAAGDSRWSPAWFL